MKSTRITWIKNLALLVSIFLVAISIGISKTYALPGFEVQTLASGFNIPTALAFLPDGRILV
jgi:hypothetical protein